MENEHQFIARHVAADIVRKYDESLAELLEQADIETLARVRKYIKNAKAKWSKEFGIFAMRHDSFYWRLIPKRIDSKDDGPLVKFEWGWNAGEGPCPSVTSSGEDAFDMALEILQMFVDENGEPQRPERPEHKQDPEVSRCLDEMFEGGDGLMEALGGGGYSLRDLKAWVASGKPLPPLKHEWVAYPEDHVEICSICGEYWRTNPEADDYGGQVCPGVPQKDEMFQTIHIFDPRRSEGLREAQRLDVLTKIMAKASAKPEELEPLLLRLNAVVGSLEKADRSRYEKERVGVWEE
jgi:hypothetical protein